MGGFKRSLAAYVPVLLLGSFVLSCAPASPEGVLGKGGGAEARAQVYRRSQPMMGTGFEIQVVSRDGARAAEAIDAAFLEIERVEALLSEWRQESEISDLNRRGAKSAVAVGPELFEVIERGLYFGEVSGGAFDITFATCAGLWSGGEEALPEKEEVERCVPQIDYEAVILDRSRKEIRFARAGTKVGIGGIGKGYGVDRAAAVLKERGLSDFVVDGGGDLHVSGTNLGAPWTVGVMNPRAPDELLGLVRLSEGAVATSGDYERFFIKDGVRYHHIIDPRTGWPAQGTMAVTVVATNTTDADALATALFVLGPERGLELVERLDGVEALIVAPDLTLTLSAGMGAYFEPQSKQAALWRGER